MKRKSYILLVLLISCSMLNLPKAFSQNCVGPLSINLDGSRTADSLIVAVDAENIRCANDDEGQLTLLVEGGNPSYQYAWSDLPMNDSVRYDLAVGLYVATITDSEGCTKEVSWNIEQLNATNSDLAMNNSCGVCWISDGGSSYFFNENTAYIASLSDDASVAGGLEDTEVCFSVDPSVNTCNGAPYLQRHWSIKPTHEKEACLKLFFTQEELDNLADAVPNENISAKALIDNKRICVTAFRGASENCSDFDSSTTYSMSDTAPLIVTEEDPIKGIWSVELCVEEYASFYLNVCDQALPVELVYFSGKRDGGHNLLFWETASERNTDYFELEKADKQGAFHFLGTVAAVGNSTETNQYQFRDEQVSEDYDYYRLKIVDMDGTYDYSSVVVIHRTPSSLAKIYPSLFDREVHYETNLLSEDHLEFVVYDAIGHVAHRQNARLSAGKHKLSFKLDKLPSGIYFLEVYSDRQNASEAFKLIKR